jgi:hypothetical protein
MENKKFNVKGLGEWRVIQTNDDTRYAKVEGPEGDGNVVSVWIPFEMVNTMTNREELLKKNDSFRKSADYFKTDRNALQKRNTEYNRKIEELIRTNKTLMESLEVLRDVQSENTEDMYSSNQRHRVTVTIMAFMLVVESVVMVMFCLNN